MQLNRQLDTAGGAGALGGGEQQLMFLAVVDSNAQVALVEAQRFVIGQGQGIGAACFYAKAESGGR